MSRMVKKFIRSNSQKRLRKSDPHPQESKLVVAHFMVGNTAPYTPGDWEEDIKLANNHGIDGFALNVGKEEWQLDQVARCFDAAERSDTDFKLFLSFDMSSLASSTCEDIQFLKMYVSRFALHAHYLYYMGKALVSTFAGENALFGCDDVDSAWMFVKYTLEKVCPIFFIPSFFIDPRRFRTMSCLNGAFNWNGCWPIHLTPDSPPEEIRYPKLLSDVEYLRNLRIEKGERKAYMASVSPWFFTHYGKDSWNKNVWIYRGDDWLLVRRWQQLIAMRDDVDIVQIISWNDYGESHYIGPVKGAQPNSEAWVNGFDHTAWLHLCGCFARVFKAGPSIKAQPEASMTVEEDRLYVWARPHPRDAEAYADSVGKPAGWELTEDTFWVVVLARAPARILLWSAEEGHCSQSGRISRSPADRKPMMAKHDVPAGLSMLSCPFVAGGGIHVQLVRNGNIVLDFHPHHFVFDERPRTYNFNAYVAMYPC